MMIYRSAHQVTTATADDRHALDAEPDAGSSNRSRARSNVLAFPTSASERGTALLTRGLLRLLEDAERSELAGPHVVIARSYVTERVFGPFSSRAVALSVAAAESREWEREFMAVPMHFDVLPLVDGTQLGSAETGGPDAL
jgi:hypothetical protein